MLATSGTGPSSNRHTASVNCGQWHSILPISSIRKASTVPGGRIQFLLDQRNKAIRLHAVASHRNKRPKPDVSENDTTPAQPNRLEADPLTMLSKFQRQEACQSKIAKVFRHPLQHGGLAAAGRTGQEQVLEPGE